jgi:murein L,D-transpeptidase YcbB/YkuD
VLSSKSCLAAAAALAIVLASGCNKGGDAGPATAQAEGVTPQALQAAVTDEEARRFYEARQWQSAWNEESAQQLRAGLQNAARHGLDPATFAQGLDAGSPAEREAALTKAALSYAKALAHGRTDPKRLFNVYTLPRNEVDVAAGLAEAVGRGNVPEWIESLAPQDEEYRALSEAYMQQLQATQQPQPQPAAASDPKQKGQGKAKAAEPAVAAPAVPRDQAVALAVNLERRRWLPRQPDATRIDVNTAASFLRYIRDNAIADQRVVVNGEPGWETPQLQSPLYRLSANPDWTVPDSIERDELADLSPAEMARRNFKRENGRLVQQPGPQSALGLVKFDMQNDQFIYLHDTPSKGGFGQSERHLSHGCVRVKDAIGFARMLADEQGKRAELDAALGQRERQTTFIDFARQIPVRLLYHTAFLDGGRLVFAPDIYGWDAKVAEALGLPVPPASANAQRQAEARRRDRGADVGP